MRLFFSIKKGFPERRFAPYLFDIACTATFAYLILDSLFVMRFNGLSSRISFLGFLIPHASKVAVWSIATLIWLRPTFGWRFPFAMFFLYCVSELLTNAIWMGVHLPFGYQFPLDSGLSHLFGLTVPTTEIIFLLSCTFFIFGITLSWLFLKGRFRLKRDWSILPFVVFVGSWVLMGYQTESTIANPSYWLEIQEFIWTVLYVTMALSVFKAKKIESNAN